MTKTDPTRAPGYRGSLPSREDRLAKPWILAVLGAFVLVLALSAAGIPSRFIPDATPLPLPSVPASGSVEPSSSASAPGSASAAASPSASESASAAPSPSGQ
ncbi:MAG: hypothetical protein ACR2F5_04015 [Candidatus Limnocylindria bacterium]